MEGYGRRAQLDPARQRLSDSAAGCVRGTVSQEAIQQEPRLESVITDDLGDADAHTCEGLVRGAFGERFTPHDWQHALGGTHLILRDGDRIIGHAAVVPRLLHHGGDEFDGGFVEAVALDPEFRGTGLGARLMAAIEEQIESDDVVGVLNSFPTPSGSTSGAVGCCGADCSAASATRRSRHRPTRTTPSWCSVPSPVSIRTARCWSTIASGRAGSPALPNM